MISLDITCPQYTNSMLPISALQDRTDNIRNVCIIAHVDHGKTTLCDSLVATNGFISEKSAGKLRFLDSREDEQERMITMKSSAITLRWKDKKGLVAAGNPTGAASAAHQYLINLVDSPGHVDFTAEVSTATRLSDGAVVVVDAVEGISSQTREVLRQAWNDEVRTILLINKIDRLFINLKLTADEAHLHLSKLVEQANACAGELLQAEAMEKWEKNDSSPGGGQKESGEGAAAEDDIYELDHDEAKAKKWTYHPCKGNVLFCSAKHGWGFSIQDFSSWVAKRTGVSETILNKTLWGDYTFNVKMKKVTRLKRNTADDTRSTMFAQFCLETVRRFYLATATNDNTEQGLAFQSQKDTGASSEVDVVMLEKMIKSIPELTDFVPKLPKLRPGCVRDILGSWMPVSEVLLKHVIQFLPSPVEAASYRIPAMLEYPIPTSSGGTAAVIGKLALGALGAIVKTAGAVVENISGTAKEDSNTSDSVTKSSTAVEKQTNQSQLVATGIGKSILCADRSGPAVAYCTKYLGADLERNVLLGDRLVHGSGSNQDQFVGVLRIFAGTLRPGMTMMQATSSASLVSSKADVATGPPTEASGGKGSNNYGRSDVVTPTVRLATTTGSANEYACSPDSESAGPTGSQQSQDWVVVDNTDLPEVESPGDHDGGVGEKGSEEYQTVLKDWSVQVIDQIYTILGSQLLPVESAPAGSVVAASFVGTSVYRSERYLTLVQLTEETKKAMRSMNSTLAFKNTRGGPGGELSPRTTSETGGNSANFNKKEFTAKNWLPIFRSPYQTRSFAIVKVSVEVTKSIDHDRSLIRGLGLLHRSDPSLEITHSDSGEHIMGCCGDEHLKRTVKDLQNLYLPDFVEIRVSDPLVAVRETIVAPKTGFGNDLITLPWAQKKEEVGGSSASGNTGSSSSSSCSYPVMVSTPNKLLTIQMRAEPISDNILTPTEKELMTRNVKESDNAVFGRVKKENFPGLIALCNTKGAKTALSISSGYKCESWLRSALVTGFEVASRAGSLCEEPITNVHFVIEEIIKSEDAGSGKKY